MNKIIALVLLASALAACDPPDPKPRTEVEQGGREETRGIRNTKQIGYSGEAIADKLDHALDASEAQARQMKEAEAEAQGQAPAEPQ